MAGPYRVIVVDPPWDIGLTSPRRHPNGTSQWATELPYETLSLAEIRDLPIREQAHRDCWVLLWFTAALLEVAPATMRAWGAQWVGFRVWHKLNGGPQTQQRWCQNAEFVGVGKFGRPGWHTTRRWGAVFAAPRVLLSDVDPAAQAQYERWCLERGATCPPPRFVHSAKPPAFYADLRARTVGPRLDMFARVAHPGFDGEGHEYGIGGVYEPRHLVSKCPTRT